jgi:MoaA/NifB/PqqE/SkfB family radical SAM enzyme
MKRIGFNIDIVSACNLSCPSCPVGNSENVKKSPGIMSPELLEKILQKASSECEIDFIGLFNWTEPLIHPKLPELVEIAQSYAPCHLSSNLNLSKTDYEALLEKNPRYFRISLSGFNQSVYSKTHRGGNVEIVKKNMAKLSEAAAKVKGKTKIEVHYHRYLGNADDELLMKEYSEALGFEFRPIWAYLMPIEKVLQYVNDPASLSSQDQELVKMLALPPEREVIETSQSVRADHCLLLEDQITINSQGVVQLCCALFDEILYSIYKFTDRTFDEIQDKKRKMDICQECMSHGIHNLAQYNSPQYDRIAENNVFKYYANFIRVKHPSVFERMKIRVLGTMKL